MVVQLGRFHDAWVLTWGKNRAAIEEALRDRSMPSVRFVYVDLPHWCAPLWRIPGGIQFFVYLWQIAAYRTARALHRRIRFEAFHHVTYANDWMASIIGALLPVPFIRGPGGGAQRIPRTFLTEYTPLGRLGERARSLGQWLFRRDPLFIKGQERARAILVCNHEALQAVPPRWRGKVTLFPVNGMNAEDLEYLASLRVPQAATTFRVVSAGKLIRLKGFALAIKAFGRFVTGHSDAELLIIGDGPDRRYLEELVRSLGLQEQVCLRPWMPRHELLGLLASCDVLLFPSLRDGGGAVVIEAMAAGTPVVCLDLGGPALHVTPACGIKIAPATPEEAVTGLAEALERLYADEACCERMGRVARVRIEEAYHWDRLGERLFGLYADVFGSVHHTLTSSSVKVDVHDQGCHGSTHLSGRIFDGSHPAVE